MPIGHLWWVRRAGEPQGPFPASVIEKGIMQGRIVVSDQLSPDGDKWLAASDYPDFEVLAASGRSKLVARRLDERRTERRRPSRSEGIEGEQRSEADRRAPEDPDVVASRERATRVWDSLRPQRPAARYLPFLVLAAVTIGVFVVSIRWGAGPESEAHCGAAAAKGVNWEYCDHAERDLHGRDLQGAILRNGHLAGADLSGADLRGADLAYADLRGALLRGAHLEGARLTGTVLRETLLEGADFSRADLAFADLTNALVAGALLDAALFDRTVLPSGRVCTDGQTRICARSAQRP